MSRRRSFGFWVGYVLGVREGLQRACEASYQRGWYDALSKRRVVLATAEKFLKEDV